MKNLIKSLILVASFTVCTAAHASDLTDDQVTKEVVWQALNLMDYGTTRDISQRCGPDEPVRYSEANPLLGPCPSSAAVSRHFIAAAVLHYAITANLGEYRDVWQNTTIVIAVVFVANNLSVRLNINF